MSNFLHKLYQSTYLFLFFIIILGPVQKAYAENSQDQLTSLQLEHWLQALELPTDSLLSEPINNEYFESDEISPFTQPGTIYGLGISGSIQLNEPRSLVRVILVDSNDDEYLVYEAYPILQTKRSYSIKSACRESCLINAVVPRALKIELIAASIRLDEFSLIKSSSVIKEDIGVLRKKIKDTQELEIIKQINSNIEHEGLNWVAGETFISQLSYGEKKGFFGLDTVPNLQGVEYYVDGVFEVPSGDTETSRLMISEKSKSKFITSFDWRNRHGANDSKSPYYDGDTMGSGWITSIKNQSACGSCWAFSAVGATEALTNLYFNQHLDLNLSEQDALSCSGGGSCRGGSPGQALSYIRGNGIVDEDCFPYTASDESCDNRCSQPNQVIKIEGRDFINPAGGEERIKEMLINHGPLNFGIRSWWHCIPLVGYDIDPKDGKTIWIIKNSWGSGWGDNGYGHVKVDVNDIYLTYALRNPVTTLMMPFEIACHDKDNDGYFNWGISVEKPATCPAFSLSQKDCDDSNPSLGPFDDSGDCLKIGTANTKKLCSTLNIKARLDVDKFIFDGKKGEKVTIRLKADPRGKQKGRLVLLALRDSIQRIKLVDKDKGALPNVVKATLPETGRYRIFIRELKKHRKFVGDYCVIIKSSKKAAKTLRPTRLTE